MKFLFTILLTGVITCSFAQRQNAYFFKNNGRQVKQRDSADYTRVVREPDSGSTFYKVMEYYLNGKPKAFGQSSNVYPLKLEGAYVTYDLKGNKSSELNYKAGILTGAQHHYYPNGKLHETRTYADVIAKNENPFKRDYLVTTLNDTTGSPLVANGNGKYISYNKYLTKVITVGMIKNGLKDGEWKMNISNDSILVTENYNEGKFITGSARLANGESYTYTQADSPPEFKGGMQAFYKFLAQTLRYPAAAQERRLQGRVQLSFIVERDGSITDIKEIGISPSPILTAEAIRVISLSPAWSPGIKYGRVTRATYTVPVVFTLR
jgi:TonB family protein